MSGLNCMRLMVVDDDLANVELLQKILADEGYTEVLASEEPERVPELCEAWQPDLLLLACPMRAEAGFEVLSAIRGGMLERERLPVVVISAEGERDARHRALSLGARDFVTRPIDETELLLRVRNLLQARDLQRQLADRDAPVVEAETGRTQDLENTLEDLRTRTNELEQARLETLTLLVAVAEYHDDDTQQHTQRVGRTAAVIAQTMELPERFVAMIRNAAPLHDLGKVGISRRVLLKAGPLTAVERQNMMRHAEIGARILSPARSPVLRMAAEIARTHHERWDGDGYPTGLAGNQIPISGRITAVADVFDALTHERPGRPRWEIGRAVDEIKRQAGAQFDPEVVTAFETLDHKELAGAGAEQASNALAPGFAY